MTQAWFKMRNTREKHVFAELFEVSFMPTITWVTQNLAMVMEILQCNVISQMICIMEGLIPCGRDEEEKVALSTTGSVDGRS